jgi:hypothetical protein
MALLVSTSASARLVELGDDELSPRPGNRPDHAEDSVEVIDVRRRHVATTPSNGCRSHQSMFDTSPRM